MDEFPQNIWRRLRHSRDGRRLAGALIAGAFGASAALGISPTTHDVIVYTVAFAVMGSIGVSLLEWRDARREEQRRKRDSVRGLVREVNPPVATGHPSTGRPKRPPLSLLEWFAIVVGGFSVLCGLAMLVLRAIDFLARR